METFDPRSLRDPTREAEKSEGKPITGCVDRLVTHGYPDWKAPSSFANRLDPFLMLRHVFVGRFDSTLAQPSSAELFRGN